MDEDDFTGGSNGDYPDYDYYYSWDYWDPGCRHQWTWYVGFHIERFWYCEKCGEKDRDRPPPSP